MTDGYVFSDDEPEELECVRQKLMRRASSVQNNKDDSSLSSSDSDDSGGSVDVDEKEENATKTSSKHWNKPSSKPKNDSTRMSNDTNAANKSTSTNDNATEANNSINDTSSALPSMENRSCPVEAISIKNTKKQQNTATTTATWTTDSSEARNASAAAVNKSPCSFHPTRRPRPWRVFQISMKPLWQPWMPKLSVPSISSHRRDQQQQNQR